MGDPTMHSPSDHRAVEEQSTDTPGYIDILVRTMVLCWTLIALLLPASDLGTQISGGKQLVKRTRTTAVLHWLGGKAKLARKITGLMPQHDLYVEVFAGALHVLFNKERAKVEVCNDINKGLMGFWKILADAIKHLRLIDRLAEMPYSRDQYEMCRATWESCQDDVERAARWFVVARQTFSGVFGGTWGFGRQLNPAHAWEHAKLSLQSAHERIANVVLECDDWRAIIDRYDCPQALFYIDPPYELGQRRGGKFAHELTYADHQDLANRLLRIEGNALLSGYRTEAYKSLETAGWSRLEIDVLCSAAVRSKGTALNQPGAVLEKQVRTECLWLSPGIAEYALARAQKLGWTIANIVQ